MKRKRINNDFTFAWAIERNGLPEDLSTAINMVLRARNSTGAIQTITAYEVAGNIVSVEITPEIANVLGRYNFILTYELPDASLDDMERLCEVDTDAFIIVPRTAEADDSTDLLVTSDMAIGFKGDTGDTGNYGVVEFVVNENMELEQHTLAGDPLDFEIVDGDLVLNEAGETVNLGTVAIKDTYSYDEKIIGEWVDGKPIYRKVILIPEPDENFIISIIHNSGIDECIRMDITSNSEGEEWQPSSPMMLNAKPIFCSVIFTDRNSITMESVDVNTAFTYHLILEYTKL